VSTTTFPATLWNFAGAVPEFPACQSRLRMLNGDPARTARCSISHEETGETAHGALIGPHFLRWTDAEAVIALAWFEILPTCANCQARYRPVDGSQFCGTRCQLADKHSPADDYEAEAA
jgi:hypothetical protein